MQNQLVIIHFPNKNNSSQVFKKLKTDNLKPELNVKQVMLLQRNYDEKTFKVIDFENISGEKKEWRDSILGIIVGLLGGPLGPILGWAIGDVIGLGEAHHISKEAHKMFDHMANCIDRGEEGIMAIIQEDNVSKLNELIETQYEGKIERFNCETIEKDIKQLKKMKPNN
ncbi:hypothetical protein ACNZ61_002981 [Enterococcus hirae]